MKFLPRTEAVLIENRKYENQLNHEKVVGNKDFHNKAIATIYNSDSKHRCYLHKSIQTPVEMNINNNVTFSFFLDRLLGQLDETEKAFSQFWSKHHLKLNQCLQLQHFEYNFCEVLFSCLIELPFMVQCVTVLFSTLNSGLPSSS